MKENKLWMWIGITFVLTIMFAVLANSVEASSIINDRIVHWWDFDQGTGTTVIDKMNSRNLTLTGTYSWSLDKDSDFNSSVYFIDSRAYSQYANEAYTDNLSIIVITKHENIYSSEQNVIGYGVVGFRFNWGITDYSILYNGNYSSAKIGDTMQGSIASNTGFGCYVLNKENTYLAYFENGTLVNRTTSNTPIDNTVTNFGNMYIIGKWNEGQNFNGKIQQAIILNRSLNESEISSYCANPKPYNLAIGTQLKIVMNDFYNNMTLYNISVNLSNFAEGTYSYTNTTGNIDTSISSISSYLYNISYCSSDNGGYFCGTTLNANISSGNFAFFLFQSIVNLNATELMTGTVLSGTKSTTNYTNNSGTFYLKAGTYTFTFTAQGYYPQQKTITVSALSNTNEVITGVYNATVNMTFRDNITNAIIQNANFSVSNTTYGYYANYSTSNGSVLIPAIYPMTYFYNASSYGYTNVTSATLNVTANASNKTAYLLGQGLILIEIINANTGNRIIYQNTTVLVQNSTTQSSFNIVNGSGNISGLIEGSTYTFFFNSTGYDTTPYFITYSATLANSLFKVYLPQSSTVFNFIVKTRNGQTIENALVTIERFVNGSYIVAGSQSTNAVGSASFNVQSGIIHRITVSKDNFITQSFTDYLTATPPYEIVLYEVTSFTFDSDPAGITSSYSPTNTNLSPVLTTFEFNVSTFGSDNLDSFSISIWDNNNTLLAYNSSTAIHGGTLTATLSLLPYNQSWVLVSYDYKKDGFGTTHQFRKYYVADQEYVGTIANMRDWIANAMTLEQRTWLWLLAVVCVILLARPFLQNGEAVLGLGSIASVGLAYAFAFPPVAFTFVSVVSFIVIVFLWERG